MARSPYLDQAGLLRRCFSCGAFRNHGEPARWDLLAAIPADAQGPISHGLCDPCYLALHPEPTGDWELALPGGK
jgi:hypothetical protein